MLTIKGKRIYLVALEREHCSELYRTEEYDFENITDRLYIGQSLEKSDDWYEDIQKRQGSENIRLGIFLYDGTVIDDVALQHLDWQNRKCDLGMGIAKIANRSKGYGKEAVGLMLEFAFNNLGLERVEANTYEPNIAAQQLLEKMGFILEGRERKSVYFAGKRFDKLNYAILREERKNKKIS
jgi:RimJ/RimL family protein N-acetyltransferase